MAFESLDQRRDRSRVLGKRQLGVLDLGSLGKLELGGSRVLESGKSHFAMLDVDDEKAFGDRIPRFILCRQAPGNPVGEDRPALSRNHTMDEQ